jgi:hypothetical protein
VANSLAYYNADLNHASGAPLETALKEQAPILAHKYWTRASLLQFGIKLRL